MACTSANYDKFFNEYDRFGRDPRQAPGRDGLVFL
jgi:hypothetical protein